MVGISVIVIACPCALGLATPVATLVGLNLGARKGILFKEAAQLETMAKVDTLLLDKTGTITVGKPEVVQEHLFESFDKEYLYSLVKSSKHPISQGVLQFISEEAPPKEVIFENYKQITARGIVATLDNQEFLGGNEKLMLEYGVDVSFVSDKSLFFFAMNKKLLAVYELEDRVKDDALSLITELKNDGIEIIMLTGDQKSTAQRVANATGIPEVYAELSPEEKLAFVEEKQKDGKVIVMVGDGINDILALARADIAVVMGSGSDIAVEVSDIVLLSDSLDSLLASFKISKTTFYLIKQNFVISLLYNAITIPLAMAGYVIPLIAALSMSFSSLLVVGNSMRIKYKWNRS
jgi:Cu+-exporting ATPase